MNVFCNNNFFYPNKNPNINLFLFIYPKFINTNYKILFLNPNFMNNQSPINPIIPLMFMNQITMGNMNDENTFINPNQKELVDKIISFYQESGREYMNYNEKYQIINLLNNLDTDCPMLNLCYDITDPLPHIKEKKKLIKFINHDFKISKVKVPISIDKKALYTIAELYKTQHATEILLVYKDCILNEDESSIENISDGDFVIIIENIYYLDNTYFNSLTDKNSKGFKQYISIEFEDGTKNFIIPRDTKFSQLHKALILHYGCEYEFICKGKLIKANDNRNIINGLKIHCSQICKLLNTKRLNFGKEIQLKIKFENHSIEFNVGILNSVREFFDMIKNLISRKAKGFYFDKKVIHTEEDISFASLGIINDCEIELIFEL